MHEKKCSMNNTTSTGTKLRFLFFGRWNMEIVNTCLSLHVLESASHARFFHSVSGVFHYRTPRLCLSQCSELSCNDSICHVLCRAQ